MVDLITLGPECLSLKTMGQKNSREHLSPLTYSPKPRLYLSSPSAVPASTQPWGDQRSPMALPHGATMPISGLQVFFV